MDGWLGLFVLVFESMLAQMPIAATVFNKNVSHVSQKCVHTVRVAPGVERVLLGDQWHPNFIEEGTYVCHCLKKKSVIYFSCLK